MVKFLKKNHERILLLAGTLLVFIIIYRFFGFYYGINDDISMQKLAAGINNVGKPDGHLIFIRFILGSILAGLFTICPSIDWYGLFMIGSILGCAFLIVQRIFSMSEDSKNKYGIRVLGVCIGLFIIIDASILFQFTVVAGVLAATAIFYVSSSKMTKVSDYVISWVLLLLSDLVRVKVCYMCTPIVVGIIAIRIIKMVICQENDETPLLSNITDGIKKNKKYIGRVLTITFVGVGLILGVSLSEKLAYSEPEWSKYSEYKHYRSLIMDYYKWPQYDSNIDFWNSIGVSEEEYDCLKLYGILPNFDADTIITIGKYAESNYVISDEMRIESMKNLLKAAIKNKSCRTANIILGILLCALFIIWIKSNGITKIQIMIIILGELAVLIYLLYGGRFPTRIILMYDYQCIMAIVGLVVRESYRTDRLIKITYGLCIAVLFLMIANDINVKYEKVLIEKADVEVYQKSMEFIEEYPDSFMVVPTGTIVTAKRFTIRQKTGNPLNFYGTYGWSVFAPWSEKKLKTYNIDRTNNCLLQDNVYMLTTDVTFADKISRYYFSENLIDHDYEIVEERFVTQDIHFFLIKWNK